MCKYWKKEHTCMHLSDRKYIDMCKPGRLSNIVCPDISDDDVARPSHFPCWSCIRSESRADHEALARANQAAIEARETAAKAKLVAEARMREERVRREYREKAAREREEEAKRKEEREREMEKAKKEGGLWVETGGGKKGKYKKGPLTPVTPLIATPVIKTFLTRDKKEITIGGGGPRMSPTKNSPAKASSTMKSPPKIVVSPPKTNPAKEKPIESSGRAGVWGPKRNNVPWKENVAAGPRN